MLRRLDEWLRGEEGAIAPILVLLLIPVIGMLAMGGEVSGWYMKQRQLQNAADSAVLAAAANAKPNYQTEARGVAGQYGFATQANGDTTVSVTNAATCPDGTTGCYQVTISQRVPLYLTQVIGYRGNQTMGGVAGGRMATLVAASSIASAGVIHDYCMIGLGTGNQNLKLTGNADDYSNCDMRSNGNLMCSGSINVGHLDAPSVTSCNSSLGKSTTANNYQDPFLYRDISNKIADLNPSSCTPTDLSQTLPQTIKICGNTALPKDLNITIPNTTVLVVDGTIDLHGFALQTTSGGSASVVFTSTATPTSNGPSNTPRTWFQDTTCSGQNCTGRISLIASTAGDFRDFVLVTDPKFPTPADFTFGNKKVSFTIYGAVYAPHSFLDFPENSSSIISSKQCLLIVANKIQANGGKLGNVPGDCESSGYTDLPTTIVVRTALVK